METLKISFCVLYDGSKIPVSHNESSGHLVFDVRMTLERKSCWLKDVHKNPEPEWSTFVGFVSRESVCMA